MSRVSTSAGRAPDFLRSMATMRSTTSAASSVPLDSSWVSSSKSLATSAVSSGEPVTVISLPRTWMSAPNAPSITCSSSSREPSRLTIEWSSGITILTRVRPSADVVPVRGSVGVSVKCPSPPRPRPGPACTPCYPQVACPRPTCGCPGGRESSGRPRHRPAPHNVRVRVRYRLAGLRPGVEHDPVARVRHALVLRDLRRLLGHLLQQAVAGRRERGQVGTVLPRNDQHMHRRLRIYVTKCNSARAFAHPRRRDLPGRYAAEQAVSHGADLNLRRAVPAADISQLVVGRA